ncbi:MAG: PDDEXK nuclease domain-containing protein [Blastocatellia bacterium]
MRTPTRKAPAKKQQAATRKAISGKTALQKTSVESVLLSDLRELIITARERVASAVNSALVMLHWKIGERIQQGLLKGKRAGYGKEIVATVSRQLVEEFGRGFSEKSLWRMAQFAEVFPDEQIVASPMRELSWTHFLEIIPLKDQLQREFYAEMCRLERWSVRQLRKKISGALYERTALSRKPEKLIARELQQLRDEGQLTPDMVFRDPYFLDFLGLKDEYSEKDLEAAILRELEKFLLELGTGFTFVARQKRITVDGEDYYLDLLLFHRVLRRLVAMELKLEKFRAADKGQMELYLRWLDRYERQPWEEEPIGLILCAGKSDEQVELLQLDKSGIRVAAYLTDLPPLELLRRKLHEAAVLAREQLERRQPLPAKKRE